MRSREALLVGSWLLLSCQKKLGRYNYTFIGLFIKGNWYMKCNLYCIIQTHQNKNTGNSSAQLKITLKWSSLQGCPPDFCLLGSQFFKKSLPCQPHGRRKSHPSSHREFSQWTHTYTCNSVSCLANDSISYLRGQLPEADVSAKWELFGACRKVLCSPSNQSCKII